MELRTGEYFGARGRTTKGGGTPVHKSLPCFCAKKGYFTKPVWRGLTPRCGDAEIDAELRQETGERQKREFRCLASRTIIVVPPN